MCAVTHTPHTCTLYRGFQDNTLHSIVSIRWLQLPPGFIPHPLTTEASPDRVLCSYHREVTWALKNTKIQVAWMWLSSPGPVGGCTSTDRSGSSWNCLWAALLPPPNTPKASSPMLSPPTAEGVPRVIFNLLLGQGGPELNVMQKFPMCWGSYVEWLGKTSSWRQKRKPCKLRIWTIRYSQGALSGFAGMVFGVLFKESTA